MMAVRLKSGGIFLHVPKTGGEWVTQVLREQGLIWREFGHKHADFERTLHHHAFEHEHRRLGTVLANWLERKFTRTEPTNDFYFCFVRHPLRWYESWFRYCTQHRWKAWGAAGSRRHWHPCAALNGTGAADFNKYLRNVILCRPGYVTELFSSYAKPGIAFVGRQESLADDLVTVLRQLNENFDEDHLRNRDAVNASSTATIRTEWDPHLRSCLTQLELPSFHRFGYPVDCDPAGSSDGMPLSARLSHESW